MAPETFKLSKDTFVDEDLEEMKHIHAKNIGRLLPGILGLMKAESSKDLSTPLSALSFELSAATSA